MAANATKFDISPHSHKKPLSSLSSSTLDKCLGMGLEGQEGAISNDLEILKNMPCPFDFWGRAFY